MRGHNGRVLPGPAGLTGVVARVPALGGGPPGDTGLEARPGGGGRTGGRHWVGHRGGDRGRDGCGGRGLLGRLGLVLGPRPARVAGRHRGRGRGRGGLGGRLGGEGRLRSHRGPGGRVRTGVAGLIPWGRVSSWIRGRVRAREGGLRSRCRLAPVPAGSVGLSGPAGRGRGGGLSRPHRGPRRGHLLLLLRRPRPLWGPLWGRAIGRAATTTRSLRVLGEEGWGGGRSWGGWGGRGGGGGGGDEGRKSVQDRYTGKSEGGEDRGHQLAFPQQHSPSAQATEQRGVL